MRIFITGGTGLLGLNTLPALLQKGHSVRVLARDLDKARRVLPNNPNVSVIAGDLTRPDQWLSQLDDCDALIHAAAYFREYYQRGNHAEALRRHNVELPVLLAKEAKKRDIEQIVMVSSSGVLGPDPTGQAADETGQPGPVSLSNAYFHSKVEMEQALAASGIPVTIVRPGWMFGPNDYAPTSAGQLVRDLMQKGTVQLVNGTPLCIADARDVGEGIARILEGRATGIYNLAGKPQTALQALHTIARQLPGARVQTVPFGAAIVLAKLLEAPTRLLNRPNPIPLEGVRTLHDGVLITSGKAERMFGLTWRPFEETARDTIAFFHTLKGLS